MRRIVLAVVSVIVLTAGLCTATAAAPVPRAADGLTQRLLVIRVAWGAPETSTTTEVARTLFVDDVDAWFSEVSYGALGFTGDVVPRWLEIAGPEDTTDCHGTVADSDRIMAQAKAAALAEGYDATAYDHTIVYFPRDNCGEATPGGWADQPGKDVWVAGIKALDLVVHELGHNLGLSHAVRDLCTDPVTGSTVVLGAADCGAFPEDYFCPMGHAPAFSFDVAEKDELGWLTGHKTALTAGSSVTVAPLETASATNAAYVTAPDGRTYWLEYRQRTGVDHAFPETATHGVVIYLRDAAYNQGSVGLDMHPGTLPDDPLSPNEQNDAPLDAGQSWTSPDGYTFAVTKADAAGATVRLSRAGTLGAPTSLRTTTDDAARSATLRWAPPTADGGTPVVGYEVSRDGVDSHGTGDWSARLPASARAETFTLLRPATSYTLSVAAVTADGSVGPSASRRVTTGPRVSLPGAPRIRWALGGRRHDGVTSVSAGWGRPVNGGPVGTYVVRATDGWTGASTRVAVPAAHPWARIGGLHHGHPYVVTVLARNRAGSGPASRPSRTVVAR